MQFLRRWHNWWHRNQVQLELTKEVSDHIAARTAELEKGGSTPQQAAQQARSEFGNVTQALEASRDSSGAGLLDLLGSDLRYGLRQLRAAPGFTATAIVSLALGIGANLAVFQLIDVVALRDLPVRDPGGLVEIKVLGGLQGFGVRNGWASLTYPIWEQIRAHREGFSSVFLWGLDQAPVGEGFDLENARLIWASGEAFATLGVNPVAGRLLSTADDRPGCQNPFAVISHNWQRRFGGNPSAIGSRLTVRDKPVTIIGVTPPSFQGLDMGSTFDIGLPACAMDQWENQATSNRSVFRFGVMGRLAPGWTVDRAARVLEQSSKAWLEAVTPTGYSENSLRVWRRFRLTAEANPSGMNSLRTNYAKSLWVLLAVTGLILLIACTNLANLLLARSTSRSRELAIRLALGASRGRLIAQLFLESLLLAIPGCLAAITMAPLLSRVLVGFLSTTSNPIRLEMPVNLPLALFAAATTILAAAAFGLSTAIHATGSELQGQEQLASRGSATGRHRFSFQRAMIGAQVAISLLLVVSSLLFVRSFRNLTNLDVGFRQEGISFVSADLGPSAKSREQAEQGRRDILERLRAVPGVEAVATTTRRPLDGTAWSLLVEADASPVANSRFTWVSPGYFQLMDIPLLAGRDVSAEDTPSGPRVLVVNETFVKMFLPAGDPIGRRVRSLPEAGFLLTEYQIVGVAKDTKYSDLRQPMQPIAYAPESQDPRLRPAMILVIRSSLPSKVVLPAAKEALLNSHPGLRVTSMVAFREATLERLGRDRLLAWLTGFFGALAVLIAAIGLYGAISYITAGRRSEFGVRLALGAGRLRIISLVLRQLAAPLTVGLTVGAIVAVAISSLTRGLVFGLEATNPALLALSILMLGSVAIAATLIPALRAATLDPMAALRQD